MLDSPLPCDIGQVTQSYSLSVYQPTIWVQYLSVQIRYSKSEHLQYGLRVSYEKYYKNPKDLMLRKMKREEFFLLILNYW